MLINLKEAALLLKTGHLVGVPTETVYGLAASIAHPQAVEEIFRVKGRPRNNPLIVHVAEKAEAETLCDWNDEAQKLADLFWPGPLTLVLPTDTETVPENVRAGLQSVAVRMPNHPLTLKLLKETGPLVMPSANLSGKPSGTRPSHLEEDFGGEFPVLDGGPCSHGMESTVLLFLSGKWMLGRLGAISVERLAEALGYVPEFTKNQEQPLCPGQKYRHYSPQAKLILEVEISPQKVGVVLGFSDRSYPGCRLFALGDSQNAEEAARNLYHILRQLDQEGVKEAWVDMDFPKSGLWQSVRERLQKAAD